MITTVSNTADLLSAIHSAADGDTILLAAGSYTNLSVGNVHFASGITIESADASHPAIVAGINLTNSSGVTFKGLEVTVDPRNALGVNIAGDDNVHLENLNIHGPGTDNSGSGVMVRSSTNVSVDNSEIHFVNVGVQHLSDDHLTISGNNIHDLQGDGIKGGGSNYVTVDGNHFTNFTVHPGDHPDAIQFWTTGTTASAHDITISNNVYVRGAGDAVQGIFMGNELGYTYENVTITGNAMSGTMYHGISVYDADNVHVSDNFVQGYQDMPSWIQMYETTNSSLEHNVASSYIYANNGNVGLQTSDDTTINLASIGDNSAMNQWLAAQGSSQSSPPPADTSSGSGTGGSGSGSGSGGGSDSGSGGDSGADAPSGGSGDGATGGDQSSTPPASGGSSSSPSSGGGADGGSAPSGGQGSAAPVHDADETLTGAASGDTVTGGSGNDSIIGGDGVNYLRGGQGDDHMVGGAHFDDMNGNEGADTLSGGLGDDWVVGGKDNDNVAGDDGNDIVYGNLGNDTCDGGTGADIVRGGQGDDVVVGGAGDDWLSGDRGNDTLTGGAGADTFHSFSGAGIDVVTDFNAAEGDRVQLDPGTRYTVSQVGADVHIDMGNGDEVILQGVNMASLHDGWIFGA